MPVIPLRVPTIPPHTQLILGPRPRAKASILVLSSPRRGLAVPTLGQCRLFSPFSYCGFFHALEFHHHAAGHQRMMFQPIMDIAATLMVPTGPI